MRMLSVMAVVIDFTELSAIYERGKTAQKSGSAKVIILYSAAGSVVFRLTHIIHKLW